MVKTAPLPKPRAVVSTTATGLEITIPARRNWLLMIFLAFWLAMWTSGGLGAGVEMMRDGDPAGRAFLAVWILFWLAGEMFALLILGWSLAGKEIVRFTPNHLEIRRAVGPIGFSRHYGRKDVRNLRVANSSFNPFDPRFAFQFWGLGGGILAFDYGSATVRFANSIEESEAAELAAVAYERAPDVRPRPA